MHHTHAELNIANKAVTPLSDRKNRGQGVSKSTTTYGRSPFPYTIANKLKCRCTHVIFHRV